MPSSFCLIVHVCAPCLGLPDEQSRRWRRPYRPIVRTLNLLSGLYRPLFCLYQAQDWYISIRRRKDIKRERLVGFAGAEIMEAQTPWTENEDEADPMLPEQFQIAMDRTQIRTPELISACRLVLVENKKASEIAQARGLDAAHVRRAVVTVREKWQEICAEQGWEYLPVALPRSAMKLVLEMQREQLDKYRAQEAKGSGRKKRT
jgi:hypothetical protein